MSRGKYLAREGPGSRLWFPLLWEEVDYQGSVPWQWENPHTEEDSPGPAKAHGQSENSTIALSRANVINLPTQTQNDGLSSGQIQQQLDNALHWLGLGH